MRNDREAIAQLMFFIGERGGHRRRELGFAILRCRRLGLDDSQHEQDESYTFDCEAHGSKPNKQRCEPPAWATLPTMP